MTPEAQAVEAKVARLMGLIYAATDSNLKDGFTVVETALRTELARPLEVTDAMVEAYLSINEAYWQRTDDMPIAYKKPSRWRQGTLEEATRESLQSVFKLLAATSTKPTDLVICPRHDNQIVGSDGCEGCIKESSTKPADSALQAEPVAICAVASGQLSIGWVGGFTPRHNDKLYTTPQAPAAQPVAPGWQCVPVNLDDKIRSVLIDRFNRARQGECMLFDDIWAELLSAAPSMPPSKEATSHDQ